MAMINNVKEINVQEELRSALESNDQTKIVEAYGNLARSIEQNILKEARSALNQELYDLQALQSRGQMQLTSEERSYYEEVIEKRGFDNLTNVLPVTVVDRVFEDLEQNHPLLSEIDFVNTTGVTEWITRTSDCVAAFWGSLTDEITKELKNGFSKEKTDHYKLSAFMPVSKSMLDLGPVWLDKFVRAMLRESMAMGLEQGIVAGTGKNQPIGMIKNLKGSVVESVYPDKEAIELTDFKPHTLASKIIAPLTKGGKRTVTNVILVVNPLDYWEKVFGATTYLNAQGEYVYKTLPIPGKFIQSASMPIGKMAAGVAKDYFMGIGSDQKIEYSDEYKFLEDERTYLTKQYATGHPKDNDSFLLFDISNLDPTLMQVVEVKSETAATTRLKK